MNTNLKFSMNR